MSALKTTIQLLLVVRSSSVSARWGMLTFSSLVQWIRSGGDKKKRWPMKQSGEKCESKVKEHTNKLQPRLFTYCKSLWIKATVADGVNNHTDWSHIDRCIYLASMNKWWINDIDEWYSLYRWMYLQMHIWDCNSATLPASSTKISIKYQLRRWKGTLQGRFHSRVMNLSDTYFI